MKIYWRWIPVFFPLLLALLVSVKAINSDRAISKPAQASEVLKTVTVGGIYGITNFGSTIKLEQDASLKVTEKIEVNFWTEKHGIYRVIPYIYNNNGKTIRADLKILSVTDEKGNSIPYTVDNFNQSKRIKIGDANLMVVGVKNYIVTYVISGVVLDYGKGPEIYWNVTGNEWDVPISKSSAIVESPFGKITKTECFGCKSGFGENEANFEGGQNLTIVVQIDKNNTLKMPNFWQRMIKLMADNWGYLVAILPAGIMFGFWYKKGRDKKYLGENVYYQPEDKKEENVPLINRPHLPMVYSPIDGLSPAEMGTIIDERVDTKDVVAEIVDLARLGYLTINKIETKGFLGLKDTDYELKRSKKETDKLNKFQKNLLNGLFENGEMVKISELKNSFYKKLRSLKMDLYEQLNKKKMTDGNLEKVRIKWLTIGIILNVVIMFWVFGIGNSGPIFLALVGMVVTLILAIKMPRKTAWGYSLHRQAVGLKYFLGKGKWREEIAEKHLFLEEMLPLAISLGVVKELAEDMKELEMEPPKYFQGMAINSFANDFKHFNSAVATGLTSSPSGSGSWSGGSGFSGGGGGGFGGGGGGSW